MNSEKLQQKVNSESIASLRVEIVIGGVKYIFFRLSMLVSGSCSTSFFSRRGISSCNLGGAARARVAGSVTFNNLLDNIKNRNS